MPNNKPGVITEQGFVAGSGLGFNPINEKELNKDSYNKNQSERKTTNTGTKYVPNKE